jgi:vancomycin resistance protein YoaR
MGRKGRKTGRTFVLATFGAAALGGGAWFADARYEPRVVPGTIVARIDLGGLTRAEASERLSAWWAALRAKPIQVRSPHASEPLPKMTAAEIGLVFPVAEQVSRLPLERLFGFVLRQALDRPVEPQDIELVALTGGDATEWAKAAERALPRPSPPRAALSKGKVVLRREVPGMRVDREALVRLVAEAVVSGGDVLLPVVENRRRVPDDELAKIVEPVSTFTTRFSEGNRNRSYNIRLAARRIDGTVLMPGETFSFNKALGRRTASKGFREAGVYVSGRRDTDIGGGICQVSTTLYNAALLAGLEIVSRSPHSLSVPYVPLGRDAAVSYPSPDLAFVNTTGQPIAIAAEAGPGTVRFSILGKKVPGRTIEVSQSGHRSWSRGVKYIDDPTLPPGQQRIQEKGGLAHSVSVTRVFKQDGVVVKREDLGVSRYLGGQQIIAVNRRGAAATQAPEDTGPSEGASQTVTP